ELVAQAGGGRVVGLEPSAGDLGEHAQGVVEVQAHALHGDGLAAQQNRVVDLEGVGGADVDQPVVVGGIGELLGAGTEGGAEVAERQRHRLDGQHASVGQPHPLGLIGAAGHVDHLGAV